MTKMWFPKYRVRKDEANSNNYICNIVYGLFVSKQERVYIGESKVELVNSLYRHASLHNIGKIKIDWREDECRRLD